MISFFTYQFQIVVMFFRGIIEHHQTCHYNAPFLLIVSIIIFNYVLERVLDFLNTKAWSEKLPAELGDVYDAEQYKKSQNYKRINEQFGLLTSTFSFLVVIGMLFYHLFCSGMHWKKNRHFVCNGV